MIDVKRALDEADGDRTKAEEILRVKGLKGVTKREGRTASNGLVAAQAGDGVGTLVEVLCETDFVAKGERFVALADQVLDQAVATVAADAEALLASDDRPTASPSRSCSTRPTPPSARRSRSTAWPASRASASWRTCTRPAPTCPPQIGVLVATEGGDEAVGATSRCTSPRSARASSPATRIDAETVENERRVAEATAREEGKPEAALPRIVEGRVNGYFKENVLLEQPFAKDAEEDRRQGAQGGRRRGHRLRRFRVGG